MKYICSLYFSSKDTFVKFWDLDTQHCFYTLVGCRYEVLFNFYYTVKDIFSVVHRL